MKPSPSVERVFDLAAMRGWRTIRLDRRADAKPTPVPRPETAAQVLPKAA